MASNEERRVSIDRDGVRTVYDPRAKWLLGLTALATVAVVAAAAISMLAMRPQPTSGAPQAQQTQSEATDPLARRAGTPAGTEPIAPQPVQREVRAVHVERGSGSVVEPEEQPASEA